MVSPDPRLPEAKMLTWSEIARSTDWATKAPVKTDHTMLIEFWGHDMSHIYVWPPGWFSHKSQSKVLKNRFQLKSLPLPRIIKSGVTRKKLIRFRHLDAIHAVINLRKMCFDNIAPLKMGRRPSSLRELNIHVECRDMKLWDYQGLKVRPSYLSSLNIYRSC